MSYQDEDGNWEGCALLALGVLVTALLIFAWFLSPSP